jgi:PAS domain S-box-containing protein
MMTDSTRDPSRQNGATIQGADSLNKIFYSPLKLILLLALGIFTIELAVMQLLSFYSLPSVMVEMMSEAILLTLILVPVLYRFIYNPLMQLIANYQNQTSQLLSYKEQLEESVRESTSELKEAMSLLKAENTERIKAEKILRESEERFRQIFEQSEDAILLVSPTDHSVLDANPMAERLFNKNRDCLISGDFFDLCGATMGNPLESAVTEIISGEGQGDIESLECRITDDVRRMLSFRGKMIMLQEEKVVLTSFRDITDRVKLEKESRRIQGRLIHTNRMTSLGMLVSSVAHEINNPNNFILINAGLLKVAWPDLERLLEERYRSEGDFMVGQIPWSEARQLLPDAFSSIQDGARRIDGIIENLKQYGRNDRLCLKSLVNINDVTRLSASILNHLISRLTSRFSIDLADNLPVVKGSALQLEQVVINLIQNALQALPDQKSGVQVTTGYDAEKNEVFVRVSDEGKGIPKELSSKIMEPFFTTRLEQGGTGLGLSICSSIVKDHGGTLEFNSNEGCGATFTVRLPATDLSTNSTHDTRETDNGND